MRHLGLLYNIQINYKAVEFTGCFLRKSKNKNILNLTLSKTELSQAECQVKVWVLIEN